MLLQTTPGPQTASKVKPLRIAEAGFYTDRMPFLSHNHYQQYQSTGQEKNKETLIVIIKMMND